MPAAGGVRCGHDRKARRGILLLSLSQQRDLCGNFERVGGAFYLYKSETGERVTDDGLIRYMRAAFDGPCGGSLELLGGRALYRLAHRLRSGACEEDQDV